jgi:surface antigen
MRRARRWPWLLLLIALPRPEAQAGGPDGLPIAYQHLETDDVAVAAAAVQSALEQALSRDTRRWHNGASSGAITPLRTFRVADGRYCRDYLEVVLARGQAPAYGKGTACRNPLGRWEPIAQ